MDAARDFESLQIKTKSIEQTLLPLVKQVGLVTICVIPFVLFDWHAGICHLKERQMGYQQVIFSFRSPHTYNVEMRSKQAVLRGGGRIGRGFGDIFNLSRRHTERHCPFDLPELEQQ